MFQLIKLTILIKKTFNNKKVEFQRFCLILKINDDEDSMKIIDLFSFTYKTISPSFVPTEQS